MVKMKIKLLIYSLFRIVYEFAEMLSTAFKALKLESIAVYLGCAMLVGSSHILLNVARKQNQNYISIMNSSLEDSDDVFGSNRWKSDNYLTSYIINAFRYGTENVPFVDGASESNVKSPSVESLLLLLSETNHAAEVRLLEELSANHSYNIKSYLNDRYLEASIEEISEGDYYEAHKLLNRYFNLYEQLVNDNKAIRSNNNYQYLLRLFLQDRWELSCNREQSDQLFNLTKDVTLGAFNKNIIIPDGNIVSKDYLAYLRALTHLWEKDYVQALYSYQDNFQACSNELFKEYNAFMIVRSAFWIYDGERTTFNRNVFYDIVNKYGTFVKSDYLKVDLEYYIKIVG